MLQKYFRWIIVCFKLTFFPPIKLVYNAECAFMEEKGWE